MAKLSLWLITLAKGRPFSFLDHALRVGDSLLGLAHIDQLLHWSLGKTSGPTTATFLTEPLRRALQRAIALRRKIRETPVIDVRDAERKAGWLREAEEALGLVRLAADLLVAAALHPEKKRRAELSDEFQYRMSLAAEAWESVQRGGAGAPRGDANREELAALRREADALLAGRQPFHWPLEFPEVFLSGLGSRVSGLEQEDARVFDEVLDAARVGNLDPIDPISETRDAGFAAIVGNPPFQGGQKITGALGVPYRDYLVEFLAHGKRGSADLCAYFFLRAGGMLQQHGQAGLIATNTIAQGDTREVGLDQLVAAGFAIPRAVPSRPWPGLAAVEVAHVWVRKGAWRSSYLLNEATVSGITPSLSEPGLAVGNPYKLKANEGKSFQGSIVLGMGFVLEPEEAQALIAKDPRNAEALFPYLNGEDLNSRPDQSPSRWVINFHDWPLEQAETYPDLMAIVKEKVKPERDKITYSKAAVENWWQHERGRVEQYKIVRKKKSVLVASRVTKYVAHVYFSTDIIFDVAVNVLMDYTGGNFSTVESSLYKTWVREFASTMKMDTRYTLTDCFETFPFTADRGSGISEQGSGGHASEPRSLNPDPRTPNPNPLASIGETYHAHRKAIMADRDEGLTKTYNRFHSPDEQSADIAELRRLHVAMDNAVAAAYGWEDLDLGHGFHETKQGLRYTISEAARRVVLDRLLALNHQRYKEEVEAGLHDRGSGAGGRGSAKGGRKKQGGSELEGQGRLL
ncbi:type IIL restriction-modification enzyme MmeI [Candidatus Chloroploca sp. Khr17]|uniref:type IIL restriction-modification enzyme MmeI n=1 Tax=Candidatus Chloroploca sp. Khr17 TaxID=2496869 RepID=UPI00196AB764|nr:type IIL restriction-modification enzyme MmeI [Candidatus Chloroploca sp. Khr17]